MRIKELSTNPAKSFSSGFDKGSQAVDKLFSPSQWGKGDSSRESEPQSKATGPAIKLDKHQIRDAEGIMQAVIKGDVSVLTQQQTELARNFLNQIQKL